MGHIRRLAPVLTLVAAICVSASLLACAAPSSDEPDAEHAATVRALLPTSESLPATPARSDTAIPPTDAPATPTDTPALATDTPVPVINTPEPTYTPRPLPTYTPRPTPVPASERERAQGVPFQAETLDGSVLTLSDTYGTPTLLAFWAPW